MRQAMKRWDVGPVLLEGTGSASPELAYGRVLAVDGRRYRIQSESGNCVVDRAVSCLVEPVAGDTVLVASDPAGNGFILAVLQREATGEAPTRLLLDGPARLEVRDGSLAVTADRDLTLAAGQRLGCVAADVSVRADRGSVRVTRMSMAGRVLRSTIQRVRSVALDVDAVCRRMTQRLGDSFRYVSDHDETQAGTQRVLVEETATLHSKNTLIVSEEHVVVNAEQIHLG